MGGEPCVGINSDRGRGEDLRESSMQCVTNPWSLASCSTLAPFTTISWMSLRGRLDECGGEQQGRVGVRGSRARDARQVRAPTRAVGDDVRRSPGMRATARASKRLSLALSLTRTAADRVCPRRTLAYSIGALHGSHAAQRLLCTMDFNNDLAVRHLLDTAEPQARHVYWAHWPRW